MESLPAAQLINLPATQLITLAVDLPLATVIDLCAHNKTLNSQLCDNEDFWQQRYIAERGLPDPIPTSWKRLYLQGSSIALSDNCQFFLSNLSGAIVQVANGTPFTLVLTTHELLVSTGIYDFTPVQTGRKIIHVDVGPLYAILISEEGELLTYAPKTGINPVNLPFKVRLGEFTNDGELVFLVTTDYKLASLDIEHIDEDGAVTLWNQPLPLNITSMHTSTFEENGEIGNYIGILADGMVYNISFPDDVIPVYKWPAPVQKFALSPRGYIVLLTNGEIWLNNTRLIVPLAQDFDFTLDEMIIDLKGTLWVKGKLCGSRNKWTKKIFKFPAEHVLQNYRTVVWGADSRPLKTSFAHFSQLEQRGKIQPFKVPPQPGVNEPYTDTFLVRDVEGYEYEVRARYDPQTGKMTAP